MNPTPASIDILRKKVPHLFVDGRARRRRYPNRRDVVPNKGDALEAEERHAQVMHDMSEDMLLAEKIDRLELKSKELIDSISRSKEQPQDRATSLDDRQRLLDQLEATLILLDGTLTERTAAIDRREELLNAVYDRREKELVAERKELIESIAVREGRADRQEERLDKRSERLDKREIWLDARAQGAPGQ
ncbi:hypothetical protein FA95DRAFT_1557805 [Auriscalpium vulgare]|uniref:Uncharacterized protein n=1 Tax=Auriscalpium vulgare TaxID=40419 RepID=A0ACB8RXN4_9AGAM|nr:hypothetical protein FA95DRAFT_1557805 [Auriscalpium vulgare]